MNSQIDLLDINYFGGCPVCGGTDGYLNIYKNHMFRCDKHKTCWSIGWNLFSSWRHETEDEWKRNADMLSGYREVKPVDSPIADFCDECLRDVKARACSIGTGIIEFKCSCRAQNCATIACRNGTVISAKRPKVEHEPVDHIFPEEWDLSDSPF